MFCKKCGHQLPEDAPFCTACGVPTKNFASSVGSEYHAAPSSTEPPRKKNTWTWKFVVAVLALLVCLWHLATALYMAEVAGLFCAGAFLVIAVVLFVWGIMSRSAALQDEPCRLPWWVVLIAVVAAYAVVIWANINAERWNTYSTSGAIPVEPPHVSYDGMSAFGPGLLLIAVIVVVVCFVVKRKSQAEHNDEPTYQRAADAAQMRKEESGAVPGTRTEQAQGKTDRKPQSGHTHRDIPVADDERHFVQTYYYPNVDLAMLNFDRVDTFALKCGEWVDFEAEPTNEYDPKAIKVSQNGQMLGYIYRGNRQDMIHDYWSKDMPIGAILSSFDVKKNDLRIKLAFFQDKDTVIATREHYEAKLIGLNKKDKILDCFRWENIDGILEGDIVHIDVNTFDGTAVVETLDGSEIGELNQTAISKIGFKLYKIPFATVKSISEIGYGKYDVRLNVYY